MHGEHIDFFDIGPFRRKWNRLGYDDDDYNDLTEHLSENPGVGDRIRGSGGLMKLRWPSPEGGGKSGGSRVIYFTRIKQNEIFLMDIYPKSRQSNLTAKQKKELKKVVKQFKE